MSCGEGSSSRCATKREMTATGGEGPTIKKPCSAESEAVAGLPARPPEERATGREHEAEEEDAGAGCEAAAAVAEAEEQPPAAAPKHRMKKREIRYILNHKPFSVIPRVYEALKQSNPDLTPSPEEEADEAKKNLYAGAREFYEAEENYPKLQEWVRRELADKGYVEVDDEWVRREAESKEILQELQDKIDPLLLEHPQTEDEDDDDSDSDYSDED